MEDFRDAWGGQLDFLHRMESTPQDPLWHGEGNVFIHTSMVLEEAYREIDQAGTSLSDQERAALTLAAVFHDIAKCLVTRERVNSKGETRIVSPRHADRGRSYLALRLPELGLQGDLLWTVLDLVGHHHDPRYLVEKDAPAWKFRRLARQANTRLLYHFEQADIRGRICLDRQGQLEILDLFRLGCEEAGAWGDRAPFQREIETVLRSPQLPEKVRPEISNIALRDLEEGAIFTGEEAIARSYAFRERPSRLTLLTGPAGTGKSTWVAQQEQLGADVISLDSLREKHLGNRNKQQAEGKIAQEAKELVKQTLRAGKHAFLDATNLIRDRRQGWIGLARDYGAATRIVAFSLPLRELQERNRQREHTVPQEVLHRQIEKLEWPYAHEADVLEIVDDARRTHRPWKGFEAT